MANTWAEVRDEDNDDDDVDDDGDDDVDGDNGSCSSSCVGMEQPRVQLNGIEHKSLNASANAESPHTDWLRCGCRGMG